MMRVFQRLASRMGTGLLICRRDNARDSADCRHDGEPPFCLTCTMYFVHMP